MKGVAYFSYRYIPIGFASVSEICKLDYLVSIAGSEGRCFTRCMLLQCVRRMLQTHCLHKTTEKPRLKVSGRRGRTGVTPSRNKRHPAFCCWTTHISVKLSVSSRLSPFFSLESVQVTHISKLSKPSPHLIRLPHHLLTSHLPDDRFISFLRPINYRLQSFHALYSIEHWTLNQTPHTTPRLALPHQSGFKKRDSLAPLTCTHVVCLRNAFQWRC